jgi:plastocyanin
MRSTLRSIAASTLFVLVPVLVSCGDDDPTDPSDNVVEVLLNDDLTFTPANVTIAPGTTVRWRSVSTMSHTVTPDGHSAWSAASLGSSGTTFEHTFNGEGTFEYLCEPHVSQGMRGSVVVES